MRRISLLLVVVMMFAGGLNAANKFDSKLEQLKKTNPNDTVRVIIQGIDPAFMSPQAAAVQAKLLKKFKYFHGFTMELKVKDLDKLANWHLIISVDAPIKGHGAADGLEAPNNSSGALAAI